MTDESAVAVDCVVYLFIVQTEMYAPVERPMTKFVAKLDCHECATDKTARRLHSSSKKCGWYVHTLLLLSTHCTFGSQEKLSAKRLPLHFPAGG